RLEESLKAHEEGLATLSRVLGERSLEVQRSLMNMGGVYQMMGKMDRAIEYHTQALAQTEKYFGPDTPELAYRLLALGEDWVTVGKPDRALPLFARARPLITGSHPNPVLAGQCDFLTARALWSLGRERSKARALAEGALKTLEVLPAKHPLRVEMDAWLKK